eukprot:8258093-Lingulodinium_polyedra.AAC.1
MRLLLLEALALLAPPPRPRPTVRKGLEWEALPRLARSSPNPPRCSRCGSRCSGGATPTRAGSGHGGMG